MSLIESPKTYTGNDLEKIFFRPMLTGPSAQELGVRVLYNMPVPTTIQLWEGNSNILKSYNSAGWEGGDSAVKAQKTISLNKVKAEQSFSASDYFSLVYEQIVGRADVNLDDLTGTELELAETELFKRSIAESIRATMWVGDTQSESSAYKTFDGFITLTKRMADRATIPAFLITSESLAAEDAAVSIFDKCWELADERLKDLKAEGQLAIFVSSDIYNLYEKYLDKKGVDSAYTEMVQGRNNLAYHGIPIIDVHVNSYLSDSELPATFCIFTDRRNLVLAVNTADFPGNEIRMWYNPDLMENRQRAIFMAGCEILDERVMSFGYSIE